MNKFTLESFYPNFSLLNIHDVKTFLTCYNESIPLKKNVVSVKDQLKPWVTPAIKSSIKKRLHYFSLYKQNRMSKHVYNSFRNRINNDIRYAKKDYCHTLFRNIKKRLKANVDNNQ